MTVPSEAREPSLLTHVRFAHPDYGYPAEQKKAADLLEPGATYPLVMYWIGQGNSAVELGGFRGEQFNAVMFEPAEDPEDGSGATFTYVITDLDQEA